MLTHGSHDDWTAQLSMMEEYDKYYDIFDHDLHADHDPLSIIGMHPAENPITGSRLETLALEVVAYRIPELTNSSLLEVLNFPRWLLDRYVADGRKARIRDEKEAEEMKENLDALKAGSGGQKTPRH